MLESVIPIVLFFVVSYIGTGILLYIPLHYTRGIPDSLGYRKRYLTIVLSTYIIVASIAISLLFSL